MLSTKHNSILLQLYTFFSGMLFIVPVIVPYYKEHIGLSFHDFMLGEVAFSFVVFAFEVPSGLLSDVWSRKRVLVLAMIVEIIGFIVLLNASSLFMTVLAQSILGVAISLFSGTNSALLYDSLLADNREDEFQKQESKRLGLSLYSIAGASVVGGFLYEISPTLPIKLSIVALCVSMFCAVLMVEPERHKSSVERHPLIDMASTVKYALHGHAEVGLIILTAAVLFSCTKLIMWSQQPYYMSLDIPEAMFGILMAVGYFLGGSASHFSHVLSKWINNVQALFIAWGVTIFVCMFSGLIHGYVGVALLMIGGSCIYGASNPRVNAAINNRVGSERRATILSTASLLRNLLFMPLGILIGWLVDITSIYTSLLLLSLWLIVSGIFISLLFLKVHRKKSNK